MGNNQDWEELKKWQEEQAKKEQENIMQRLRPTQGYKEKELEDKDLLQTVAKTVHNTKSVGNFFVMNGKNIRTLFTAIACCVLMVFWYWFTIPKPEKKMKETYDKTSTLVSVENIGEEIQVYTYSLNETPDFHFHVQIKDKKMKEDVQLSQIKYFFESQEEAIRSNFKVEEKMEEGLLIQYDISRPITKFSEIPKAVEDIFALRKLGEKALVTEQNGYKQEKMIGVSSSVGFIQISSNATLEEAKETVQRDYVKAVSEQEEIQDSEITNDVIAQYAKPDTLKVYLNGKKIRHQEEDGSETDMTATYRRGEYQFHFCNEFFEAIPEATAIDDYSFRYKGIDYEIGHPNAKYNLGFYEADIKKVFGATFSYDYVNEIVRISIK